MSRVLMPAFPNILLFEFVAYATIQSHLPGHHIFPVKLICQIPLLCTECHPLQNVECHEEEEDGCSAGGKE